MIGRREKEGRLDGRLPVMVNDRLLSWHVHNRVSDNKTRKNICGKNGTEIRELTANTQICRKFFGDLTESFNV